MGKSDRRKDPKSYMVYAGIGMSLCTEIVVAGFVGWWLGTQADKRWGTNPFGMLTGIVLFLSVSFWHLVRVLRIVEKQIEKEEEQG